MSVERGSATPDPDDVTLWAGRLRPWPAADPIDDAAPDAEEPTRVVRRSAAAPAPAADPDELPERTIVRASAAPATRRAAASRPPSPPGPAARVPDTAARETYAPRHAEPVVAARRAPAPPRALDDGGVVPSPARPRLRAGWLIAAGALVVLAGGAVIGAIALLGT